MSKAKRLCLYLHTHWDREWYLSFEEYRTQLTLIVADIMERLERGQLPAFMLDGQSCILEDLEQVDNRLTERIALLMAAGKVEAGPWYVLADQILVSGESLLRNLEMGLGRDAAIRAADHELATALTRLGTVKTCREFCSLLELRRR